MRPNQAYHLVYLKPLRPRTSNLELHLATFDGSKDIVYLAQYGLSFHDWHPDSYHFVYYQNGIFRPYLGSVCGSSVPLLGPADTPAPQIEWVDAARFLFIRELDPYRHQRELRLGQIGGPSILIGPFNGETQRYFFNLEEAPLGQE